MHDDEDLPSEEDIEKLSSGLNEKVEERTERLRHEKTAHNWRLTAEAVMARSIVFNGKRGSDVAQMTLLNYEKSMTVKKNLRGVIYASLTEEEKEYAACHHIIRVKGKRNRVNDVIITDAIKESMDLLTACRKECGVPESNEFIFAVPGYSGNLQSSPVMKKFKEEYNVENMDTRKIRKYLATIVQAKPGSIEVHQWASHFGHNDDVHKEHYR